MWPHCHGNVTNDEPEGDERYEVVELVGSVHHETEHDHQQVQTKQNLQ